MRKDLARYMIRGRTRADKGQEKKTWSPHDVTRPLDTWDPATPELVQLKDKEPDVPESRPWGRANETPDEIEPKLKPKPVRVLGKKRTVRLSITVSEEEEDIIKTHVSGEGTTVSEFARRSMFVVMARKLPPRH
jgi:hypothetical protein